MLDRSRRSIIGWKVDTRSSLIGPHGSKEKTEEKKYNTFSSGENADFSLADSD